MVMKLQ